MVATDVYRPAAIDQLVTLGKQVDVPVFEMGTTAKPPEIAKKGLAEAKRIKADVVLVDTAGRLQASNRVLCAVWGGYPGSRLLQWQIVSIEP